MTKCQGGPRKVWFSGYDPKPFPPVNHRWWRAVLFDIRSKHEQEELFDIRSKHEQIELFDIQSNHEQEEF